MSEILETISIIRWIDKNKIKTESGDDYEIMPGSSHYFMFEPLQILAKGDIDIVTYKAAQIGFSTASVLATFWVSKYRRKDIIYTLPTSADVKDFAGGKINRIIAQNPCLLEMVKDHDTIEQKSIGDNIIYYRGTWSNKAAMMVSSSLNAYDEVDASNQAVIEQYETRQQAEENGGTQWYFSHPSVPGNGVAKHWEKSDQRHWIVKCNSCEEEQFISFPESFDMEKKVYQCKHCQAEITNETKVNGRWRAKYVDREMVGFWMPLWLVGYVTAERIIKLYNTKSEEYFYNKVLGLPYVGSGNKPMISMIEKNLTDEVNPQDGRIVIGCDTGLTQYYVLGNERGLFHYGSSKGYDEVIGYMKRWKNAVIVFDAGGDLVKPREIREMFIGRVFLCHYSVDRKSMQMVRWGKGKEEGNVTADRNRMIQLVIDEMEAKRVPLFGSMNDWYDLWLHWNNIYRVETENKLGIKERKWERSGADHWVHAQVYQRIGMDRFGTGTGAIINAESTIGFAQTGPTISPRDTVPAMKPRLPVGVPYND